MSEPIKVVDYSGARSLPAGAQWVPNQSSIHIGRSVRDEAWMRVLFPMVRPNNADGLAIEMDSLGHPGQSRYQWTEYPSGALTVGNYELSNLAPYHKVGMEPVMREGVLRHIGLAAEVPYEKRAAWQFNLPEILAHNQALPQMLASLSIQKNAAVPILTANPTTYFGSVTAIAGGSEWGTGSSNLRGNIQTAAQAVSVATGLATRDLVVVMTQSSWFAATNDAGFRTWSANRNANSRYDIAGWDQDPVLAQYLGVGAVVTILTDPSIVLGDRTWIVPAPGVNNTDPEAVSIEQSTADLLDIDQPSILWNYGRAAWGMMFAADLGTPSNPYELPDIRATYFPFDRYYDLQVVNKGAGAVISNCAP
jgi:hypothetical protein